MTKKKTCARTIFSWYANHRPYYFIVHNPIFTEMGHIKDIYKYNIIKNIIFLWLNNNDPMALQIICISQNWCSCFCSHTRTCSSNSWLWWRMADICCGVKTVWCMRLVVDTVFCMLVGVGGYWGVTCFHGYLRGICRFDPVWFCFGGNEFTKRYKKQIWSCFASASTLNGLNLGTITVRWKIMGTCFKDFNLQQSNLLFPYCLVVFTFNIHNFGGLSSCNYDFLAEHVWSLCSSLRGNVSLAF